MNNPVQVTLTQAFNSTPEKVFDAWLNIEQISKWMFGPNVRDEEIIRMKLEPETGGKFSFVVKRDGKEINHLGTYLEIIRPTRLKFTWGVDYESEEESIVTITIKPTAQGCELTLKHQLHPKWQLYAGQTEKGWQYMLRKLEKL